MAEPERPSAIDRVMRFCLDNKLVVGLLIAFFLFWGVLVAPFDWRVPGVPRDPVPVDAIPDTGENQQIVFTEWPGRSPQDVEDQVTYPLTVSLLGVPNVKTIRSTSMFGFSSIFVIFDDDVDFYWSRSRILEKLNSLPGGTMPEGVQPALGPDATPLGQVFWYTLEGRDPDGAATGGWDPQELRTVQDWYVRYALASVEGVAEVASIGGFVKEYQIDVDPDAMRAHGVTLQDVFEAVRGSNIDVGARTIEVNRVEYVIRGLGFLESVEDLEQTVVKVRDNVPITIRQVAAVGLGPALRRGALDKGGAEAVGGVVVVRYGENPLAVIQRVKRKIDEIAPGMRQKTLPDGTVSKVTVVPFYDRSGLIYETLGTLSTALSHEILVTILVVLVMVAHFRSAMLVSGLLPLAVLMCFIAMKHLGVDANIVALSGIAIAIGTMVDMGIVISENILKHVRDEDSPRQRYEAIYRGATEVGGAVLTAVLTTVVSFLPVFTMQAEEGKLFRPLAFTKTFALIASIVVALTIIPPVAHVLLSRRSASTVGRYALVVLLVVAGVASWVLLAWWAGAIVLALAAWHAARTRLPASVVKAVTNSTSLVVAVAVGTILTFAWEPLGPEKDIQNLVFTAVLFGGLLVLFWLFQRGYEAILRWCLRHKVLFLSLPTVLVLLGATAWLGFDAVFGFVHPARTWLFGPDRAWSGFDAGGYRDVAFWLALAAAALFVVAVTFAAILGWRRLVPAARREPAGAWLSRNWSVACVGLPALLVPVGLFAVFGGLSVLGVERPTKLLGHAAFEASVWARHQVPGLGKEFMPPLDEGSYLFMPTTMPHASIGEAIDVVQKQDMLIRAVPEVESVVGKIGRVESPLDPAPISMIETVVTYKSEYAVDKAGRRLNFAYDPESEDFVRDENGALIPDDDGRPFRQWRDHIKEPDDIFRAIEAAARLPGVTGAPRLQPIKTRMVMLQTGMRAAMGVKVYGPDLATVERVGFEVERLLKQVPSVSSDTVVADRILGQPYLEIDIDRAAVARYGLGIRDVQEVIEVAIGGKPLTTTVEGRERYPVRVRYLRELRDDYESPAGILVPAADGTQIPLGQLAEIRYTPGPTMIKSEDTFLVGYITFDKRPGHAEVDVVDQCREWLADNLEVPAGVSYRFAGSYESQLRATATLRVALPLALFIIFLILYLHFRSTAVTLMVFSGVFVAWSGGFLMLWLYGQDWFFDFEVFGTSMRELFQVHTINLSVAVWVGFLALFGIATDDGVIMGTYLRQSFAREQPRTVDEVRDAVVLAGKRRIRPCLMTSATTLLALIPVLTSQGRGSDVMVPMAIPSFGGMTVVLITVFVVPTLYCTLEERSLRRRAGAAALVPTGT